MLNSLFEGGVKTKYGHLTPPPDGAMSGDSNDDETLRIVVVVIRRVKHQTSLESTSPDL